MAEPGRANAAMPLFPEPLALLEEVQRFCASFGLRPRLRFTPLDPPALAEAALAAASSTSRCGCAGWATRQGCAHGRLQGNETNHASLALSAGMDFGKSRRCRHLSPE